MLRKRLITVLTMNDGVLFRTKEFTPDYRYTLNFVDAWSVDEIAVLDVTRPGMGERRNFLKVVREFAGRCFVPIAAGGLVGTMDDVRELLASGADKIVINTRAVEDPEFITAAASYLGSQSLVVSIDARRASGGGYEVVIDQGRRPTGLDPREWAAEAVRRGAGEILLTSVERDGSLEGYEIDLLKRVASGVNVPVLISGGAGRWEHFVEGFEAGAAGVCTACIYHFTDTSIRSAKRYLAAREISVRLDE